MRLPTPIPVVALLLLAGRPAAADVGPELPRQAFYLSPGVTFGGETTPAGRGGVLLGGEVSAPYWRDPYFVGPVIEAVYDWARHGPRVMGGVVLGHSYFGIDGGYLADLSGPQAHHGGAVRSFVTLGVVGLFARYGALVGAPDFVDFGIFLKLPLKLWGEPRDASR